jgi:hypothetical protein
VAGRKAREARRRADEALAHEITVIHIASRRNYGVPRVTAELRRQGRVVNRKRVARVMREHGIVLYPAVDAVVDDARPRRFALEVLQRREQFAQFGDGDSAGLQQMS